MTRGLAAAILGGVSVILGFATAVPHVIVLLVALIFVRSPMPLSDSGSAKDDPATAGSRPHPSAIRRVRIPQL